MLTKGSVFVYPCEDLSGATFQPLVLPHPGTSQPQAFLYNRTDQTLLELHNINRPETSCFVADNQLISHGNLTAGVVFDVHLVLAPLLPREAFLSRDDWQRDLASRLDATVGTSLALIFQLPVVDAVIGNLCDVKLVADLQYFRFSAEKFVDYVSRKFQNAISDFTPLVPFLEGDAAAVLMDAVEAMVFDPEISALIRGRLGIAKKEFPTLAEAPKKNEPPKKKPKVENKKTLAPAGCQKISSFFTKK